MAIETDGLREGNPDPETWVQENAELILLGASEGKGRASSGDDGRAAREGNIFKDIRASWIGGTRAPEGGQVFRCIPATGRV